MDPRTAQTSRPDVGLLLAKGKLIGCLTTGQSKRSSLDSSDINSFHELLQLAIRDATHSNKEFKKCVAWIVCHVAKSRRRVAALGDYLLKLSESLAPIDQHSADTTNLLRAQTGITMLHLLDAVFTRMRENPGHLLRKPLETYMNFAKAIEPTAAKFVVTAAPTRVVQAIHLHRDLARLLSRWTRDRLFTNRIRLGLRNTARKAYVDWLEWLQGTHPAYYDKLITKISPEDSQNDFPQTHGVPEDAWFDLPAGAMVHALKSVKPGHPMRTADVKPLNMPIGSVDLDMMNSVLDHVEECKNINAIPNMAPEEDQDEYILNGLGLRLTRDSASGNGASELKVIEGYYGLSVPFMKIFEAIDKNPPARPERPQNWVPPPPPEFVPPPPFHMNFPPSMPPPPPNREGPYTGGGGYRTNDRGNVNGSNWRGGENRGGGGGNWRGRGRGGGGAGRNWGAGGGYRPY